MDSEEIVQDIEKRRSEELDQLAKRYRKASISVTNNDMALLDGTGGLKSPLVILNQLKTSNYSNKNAGMEQIEKIEAEEAKVEELKQPKKKTSSKRNSVFMVS